MIFGNFIFDTGPIDAIVVPQLVSPTRSDHSYPLLVKGFFLLSNRVRLVFSILIDFTIYHILVYFRFLICAIKGNFKNRLGRRVQ